MSNIYLSEVVYYVDNRYIFCIVITDTIIPHPSSASTVAARLLISHTTNIPEHSRMFGNGCSHEY